MKRLYSISKKNETHSFSEDKNTKIPKSIYILFAK